MHSGITVGIVDAADKLMQAVLIQPLRPVGRLHAVDVDTYSMHGLLLVSVVACGPAALLLSCPCILCNSTWAQLWIWQLQLCTGHLNLLGQSPAKANMWQCCQTLWTSCCL